MITFFETQIARDKLLAYAQTYVKYTCVCWTSGNLDEHVLELVCRTKTMEKREHSANTKGLIAEDTERLPANFNHISSIQDTRTNCCARLHISITTISSATPRLLRSIRVPARIIHYGGAHSSSAHHHNHVRNQSVCYRYRS